MATVAQGASSPSRKSLAPSTPLKSKGTSGKDESRVYGYIVVMAEDEDRVSNLFAICKTQVLIGRGSKNDIRLNARMFSRLHVTLNITDDVDGSLKVELKNESTQKNATRVMPYILPFGNTVILGNPSVFLLQGRRFKWVENNADGDCENIIKQSPPSVELVYLYDDVLDPANTSNIVDHVGSPKSQHSSPSGSRKSIVSASGTGSPITPSAKRRRSSTNISLELRKAAHRRNFRTSLSQVKANSPATPSRAFDDSATDICDTEEEEEEICQSPTQGTPQQKALKSDLSMDADNKTPERTSDSRRPGTPRNKRSTFVPAQPLMTVQEEISPSKEEGVAGASRSQQRKSVAVTSATSTPTKVGTPKKRNSRGSVVTVAVDDTSMSSPMLHTLYKSVIEPENHNDCSNNVELSVSVVAHDKSLVSTTSIKTKSTPVKRQSRRLSSSQLTSANDVTLSSPMISSLYETVANESVAAHNESLISRSSAGSKSTPTKRQSARLSASQLENTTEVTLSSPMISTLYESVAQPEADNNTPNKSTVRGSAARSSVGIARSVDSRLSTKSVTTPLRKSSRVSSSAKVDHDESLSSPMVHTLYKTLVEDPINSPDSSVAEGNVSISQKSAVSANATPIKRQSARLSSSQVENTNEVTLSSPMISTLYENVAQPETDNNTPNKSTVRESVSRSSVGIARPSESRNSTKSVSTHLRKSSRVTTTKMVHDESMSSPMVHTLYKTLIEDHINSPLSSVTQGNDSISVSETSAVTAKATPIKRQSARNSSSQLESANEVTLSSPMISTLYESMAEKSAVAHDESLVSTSPIASKSTPTKRQSVRLSASQLENTNEETLSSPMISTLYESVAQPETDNDTPNKSTVRGSAARSSVGILPRRTESRGSTKKLSTPLRKSSRVSSSAKVDHDDSLSSPMVHTLYKTLVEDPINSPDSSVAEGNVSVFERSTVSAKATPIKKQSARLSSSQLTNGNDVTLSSPMISTLYETVANESVVEHNESLISRSSTGSKSTPTKRQSARLAASQLDNTNDETLSSPMISALYETVAHPETGNNAPNKSTVRESVSRSSVGIAKSIDSRLSTKSVSTPLRKTTRVTSSAKMDHDESLSSPMVHTLYKTLVDDPINSPDSSVAEGNVSISQKSAVSANATPIKRQSARLSSSQLENANEVTLSSPMKSTLYESFADESIVAHDGSFVSRSSTVSSSTPAKRQRTRFSASQLENSNEETLSSPMISTLYETIAQPETVNNTPNKNTVRDSSTRASVGIARSIDSRLSTKSVSTPLLRKSSRATSTKMDHNESLSSPMVHTLYKTLVEDPINSPDPSVAEGNVSISVSETSAVAAKASPRKSIPSTLLAIEAESITNDAGTSTPIKNVQPTRNENETDTSEPVQASGRRVRAVRGIKPEEATVEELVDEVAIETTVVTNDAGTSTPVKKVNRNRKENAAETSESVRAAGKRVRAVRGVKTNEVTVEATQPDPVPLSNEKPTPKKPAVQKRRRGETMESQDTSANEASSVASTSTSAKKVEQSQEETKTADSVQTVGTRGRRLRGTKLNEEIEPSQDPEPVKDDKLATRRAPRGKKVELIKEPVDEVPIEATSATNDAETSTPVKKVNRNRKENAAETSESVRASGRRVRAVRGIKTNEITVEATQPDPVPLNNEKPTPKKPAVQKRRRGEKMESQGESANEASSVASTPAKKVKHSQEETVTADSVNIAGTRGRRLRGKKEEEESVEKTEANQDTEPVKNKTLARRVPRGKKVELIKESVDEVSMEATTTSNDNSDTETSNQVKKAKLGRNENETDTSESVQTSGKRVRAVWGTKRKEATVEDTQPDPKKPVLQRRRRGEKVESKDESANEASSVASTSTPAKNVKQSQEEGETVQSVQTSGTRGRTLRGKKTKEESVEQTEADPEPVKNDKPATRRAPRGKKAKEESVEQTEEDPESMKNDKPATRRAPRGKKAKEESVEQTEADPEPVKNEKPVATRRAPRGKKVEEVVNDPVDEVPVEATPATSDAGTSNPVSSSVKKGRRGLKTEEENVNHLDTNERPKRQGKTQKAPPKAKKPEPEVETEIVERKTRSRAKASNRKSRVEEKGTQTGSGDSGKRTPSSPQKVKRTTRRGASKK